MILTAKDFCWVLVEKSTQNGKITAYHSAEPKGENLKPQPKANNKIFNH
jgi:hypothetical protein